MRALCLGSFDVLHYGHIQFLNHVARLGEVVIGLGTDEYQAGYKRAPILTYDERSSALKALGYKIVPRATVSIVPVVNEVGPHYLVAGSDWIDKPFLELSGITVTYLEQNEITLVFVPRGHDMSTSRIIERVIESV
jgi:phosphoenolpyruvate phosphomutase